MGKLKKKHGRWKQTILECLRDRAERERIVDIAAACDVSYPQLYRFLCGSRSLTIDSAERLGEYLGLRLVVEK